jgi:hypothetical protein
MASKQTSVDDAVSPRHYQLGGIEVYDYIVQVCGGLPGDEAPAVANAIKYLSRYRSKDDGTGAATHLKKARWYLDRLIQQVEAKENK